MQMSFKKKVVEKYFSFLIVLLPFLYQYKGIAYISLGELLLLPFILIFLFENKNLKFYKKEEYIFYCYILFSLFIYLIFDYFNIKSSITLILRMIYYACLIKVADKHFKWEKVYKFYIKLVVLFSLYLILQFLYYKISNNYLPIYLKYDWIFSPEQRAKDLIQHYKIITFRPSSLFLEPSYYALYCMPFLCVKILKNNKLLKEKIELILVIFAIFISKAGSGIIGLFLLISYYIFIKIKKSKISKLSYIIIFLLVGLFLLIFFTLDLGNENILYRIQKGGSIKQRVIRGLIIFKELPIFHKIFGVGINNVESYMLKNNISTPFDEANLNYMCSFLQTLNFSGIIGFTLLLNYLFSIWKKVKNNTILKGMFFILNFVMGYETILFSYRFAFLYIILNNNIKIFNNILEKGQE